MDEKNGVLARLDGIDHTLLEIKSCINAINELQINYAVQAQRLVYMDANIAALRNEFMTYQSLMSTTNALVQKQLSNNASAGVTGRSKVTWWIIGVLVTLNLATAGMLLAHML